MEEPSWTRKLAPNRTIAEEAKAILHELNAVMAVGPRWQLDTFLGGTARLCAIQKALRARLNDKEGGAGGAGGRAGDGMGGRGAEYYEGGESSRDDMGVWGTRGYGSSSGAAANYGDDQTDGREEAGGGGAMEEAGFADAMRKKKLGRRASQPPTIFGSALAAAAAVDSVDLNGFRDHQGELAGSEGFGLGRLRLGLGLGFGRLRAGSEGEVMKVLGDVDMLIERCMEMLIEEFKDSLVKHCKAFEVPMAKAVLDLSVRSASPLPRSVSAGDGALGSGAAAAAAAVAADSGGVSSGHSISNSRYSKSLSAIDDEGGSYAVEVEDTFAAESHARIGANASGNHGACAQNEAATNGDEDDDGGGSSNFTFSPLSDTSGSGSSASVSRSTRAAAKDIPSLLPSPVQMSGPASIVSAVSAIHARKNRTSKLVRAESDAAAEGARRFSRREREQQKKQQEGDRQQVQEEEDLYPLPDLPSQARQSRASRHGRSQSAAANFTIVVPRRSMRGALSGESGTNVTVTGSPAGGAGAGAAGAGAGGLRAGTGGTEPLPPLGGARGRKGDSGPLARPRGVGGGGIGGAVGRSERGGGMEGDGQQQLVPWLPVKAVPSLERIAQQLADGGKAKECLVEYCALRATALEAAIAALEMGEVRAPALSALPWSSQEAFLKAWMDVLLVAERFLCDSVFLFSHTLSTRSFRRIVRRAAALKQALHLLCGNAAAICSSDEQPEKLFSLLDMIQATQDLGSQMEDVLMAAGMEKAHEQWKKLPKLLTSSAIASIDKLKERLNDVGAAQQAMAVAASPRSAQKIFRLWKAPAEERPREETDVSVHAITSYTVNYVNQLLRKDGSKYARMLESVYRRRGGETGTRRVLNEEISDLLAALHHNMQVRAEVIAESTVAALFMLNNTAYVSNSLASTSMKEAMKQSERLKECEQAFLDAITAKVSLFVRVERIFLQLLDAI
ncbi:unnamed protein product [Closterium sp. NIES-65]|nr:unnamed protein product [Closterium sp. NIES-65]